MLNKPLFNIVLVAPEIPGNTGSIGRTCVALNLRLILIKPIAFDIDEKAVRRAGLDYWKHVDLKVYENWEEFIQQENPHEKDLFLFSRFSQQSSFFDAGYEKNCYLVFGSETKGLPPEMGLKYPDRYFALPMFNDHIRSLNLSNAATAAAYEALRNILN
ncbi:MAG: tRNA (uridine(34)/cytosine(34)/5-carboxymethylaminomethyluridine(34)-2'-O)-methyltransferase TrmL [Bdellovibrio sp. CG12_big_fil_rev_8_21_14_0_65_39_13]|nr:MAG: tRNA (uridine(34)/cytosine(34)/5-carboxymethylaminomethyluridine(34)-2'-O)-methyltransferase TrmL [Bdellovibrio sp. CG22_combo_CG10-13_8_21_14_all_39_27]PIQ61969.1 MAG: tRNA (uridine(34)/cytosine(34)/5-carboxymethylaminomethyluridine(34)-2'-O)-methyltransferase TrmL [Bdellovibrio sp. CG12_big_fil_rev_8_21_14_0_65_39_13]PIR35165.1 MAG: tRNA (uridine(34)/cytosine(34)/5-carboxymethylaminomethyluridine(34)-2'-O)-methyltransferase TrmL [Bdellovibrio sp. CG11_big_fil_rev_8_21_14_0_20_39_38]PJB